MIMIIAIIYLSDIDQQLKITFRKSTGFPLKKSTPTFYSPPPPPKISKNCMSPLFANIKIFLGPPEERGDTVYLLLTECELFAIGGHVTSLLS